MISGLGATMKMKRFLFYIGFCSVLFSYGGCQVIELDDSFLEKKGNHPWLVEFYAPWCGHCKKLEPIFHQVHLDLRQSTGILVAKVDATRFTSVAHHYEVRGYPTIKFIEGENVFTHTGDRSKEGILEFSKRAKSPHIRPINNIGKFKEHKSEHADGVFFMFVGDNQPSNELQKEYIELSKKYAVYSYFYQGNKRVLSSADVKLKHESATILCFKDDQVYEYDSNIQGSDFQSLQDWFNMERYPAFPLVTGAGINEMSETNKKLVIIVTDETQKQNTQNERFKELGNLMATKHREQYHKDFQFLWMKEPDTIEQITMLVQETPNLLVLDTSTHYFYLPEFKTNDATTETISTFLQDVLDEKSEPHGGTGILQRFKRLGYDIRSLVYSIYRESPWLALMVFGIPSLVISVVCYALCCMEPFDEEEYLGNMAEIRKKQKLLEEAIQEGDTEKQAELESEIAALQDQTESDDSDFHEKTE